MLARTDAAGQDTELADLAAEADLPLDQLLASYGFLSGAEQPAEPAEQTQAAASAQPQQALAAAQAADQGDQAMPDADSEEGKCSVTHACTWGLLYLSHNLQQLLCKARQQHLPSRSRRWLQRSHAKQDDQTMPDADSVGGSSVCVVPSAAVLQSEGALSQVSHSAASQPHCHACAVSSQPDSKRTACKHAQV